MGCVLIIATDGFDEMGLTFSIEAFRKAGFETVLASPRDGEIVGRRSAERWVSLQVERTLDTINPNKFDALVIPGGKSNCDHLKIERSAIELVRNFLWAGKAVGADSDVLELLAVANVLRGRVVVASPQPGIRNAGATIQNQKVVVDGNLVTYQGHAAINEWLRALICAVRRRNGGNEA